MLGDSLKRRRGGPDRPLKEPSKAGGWTLDATFTWVRWLGLALAVLIVSYGVGYLLSTQVFFPRPESAGSGVNVPALAGQTREDAEEAIRAAGLTVGDVRELASMTEEPGRVMAQAPVAGQKLLPGATVSLGVSAGPPELRVPPVAGLGESTARDLLESLGFDVDVQQTRSSSFSAGVVVRAEPEAGTAHELPTVVTLVVSTGAPGEDTLPDTVLAPPGLGGGEGGR